MSVMADDKSSHRGPGKTVVWVAVIALGIAAVTMAVSAKRVIATRFDQQAWMRGANRFTDDNPRIRMQQDVIRRVQDSQLTKGQLLAMLGQPDPPFSVNRSGSWVPSPVMDSSYMCYVLGVEPTRLLHARTIDVLVVRPSTERKFPTGLAITNSIAFLVQEPYPVGSKIGPAVISKASTKSSGAFVSTP